MPQYLVSLVKDSLSQHSWAFVVNGEKYDADVVSEGGSITVRMSHKYDSDTRIESYDVMIDDMVIHTVPKVATVPAGDILTLSYVIHVR